MCAKLLETKANDAIQILEQSQLYTSQIEKRQVDSFIFQEGSLEQCVTLCHLSAEPPHKLAKFSHDKSQSILYNRGVLHLVCQNPNAIAKSFQQVCTFTTCNFTYTKCSLFYETALQRVVFQPMKRNYWEHPTLAQFFWRIN